MSGKKSVFIFSSDSMTPVKTISFKQNHLNIFLIFSLVLFIASVAVLGTLFYYSAERAKFLFWKIENHRLTKQIQVYEPLLAQINEKADTMTNTKSRLMGTATLASQFTPVSRPAGGKESPLPVSIKDDLYDKNALIPMFKYLSSKIDERVNSVTSLANKIEENEFLRLSTPSGIPVKGWISSDFAFRISPFTQQVVFHEGIDIASGYGAPVRATAKGVVIFSGNKTGYGNLVTIDHGYGFVTRYGHNSRLTVSEGDVVQRGDTIALVGSTGHSTGPHVHYEVLVNGIPVNPINFLADNKNKSILSTMRLSSDKTMD